VSTSSSATPTTASPSRTRSSRPNAAGIPYIPYSAGWVGLPDQDGSLIPGEDYLTIVGEDLCALGESFAEIINREVGEGTIGILGGTPGNALSAGWQQCQIPALDDDIELVSEPADTYWVNDIALQTVLGWLSSDPDIAGYSYEYADGLYTALDAYDTVGVEVDELVITVRTDEQTLFCDWVERDNPNYQIWYSAGGNFQSRIAVTAAMLHLQGATSRPRSSSRTSCGRSPRRLRPGPGDPDRVGHLARPGRGAQPDVPGG
jgi:ABC-type sugar transport system substrate-binding protein